jgi:type VI protein secretion system component Hcp
LFLTKGSEKTVEIYATFTFEECYISSVRPGGSGGSDDPLEDITVNFKSVKAEYKKS